MKDGYKWSGGPWMIEDWTKGQEVKLVPNPKWYGEKKPNLDAVVFKFSPTRRPSSRRTRRVRSR